MALLEIGLATLGATADLVGLAQVLRASGGDHSSLFASCFTLATKRHAPKLAAFSSYQDIQSITVDCVKLASAIAQLNARSDIHQLVKNPDPPVEIISAFRSAIQIPDFK